MSQDFKEILLRLAWHLGNDNCELSVVEEGSFQAPYTKIKITNTKTGEYKTLEKCSSDDIFNLIHPNGN